MGRHCLEPDQKRDPSGSGKLLAIIDNYDSFTYNLYQALATLGADIVVYRNDAIGIADLDRIPLAGMVVSPGPGTPDQAGISLEAISRFQERIPILGVCLGHQCIGQVFGGKVVRGEQPVHGRTSEIFHDGRTIFSGLPNPFTATRYHSLVVQADALPPELEITAWTSQGEIMGVRHRLFPVEGVQFHPESILTVEGPKLLANFLGIVERNSPKRESPAGCCQ